MSKIVAPCFDVTISKLGQKDSSLNIIFFLNLYLEFNIFAPKILTQFCVNDIITRDKNLKISEFALQTFSSS